jgi:AraC family transcriptional regulator of adaptative response / methylphosphotriester-DNA alkyltransferase methyltransferase
VTALFAEASPGAGMRHGTRERRDALLREARAVLEADFAQPLSLDAVARRTYSSRRQVQRVFRELEGTSFRTALTGIRMERAAELLSETALPVHAVANRVGYRQPAQFAKAFRRHHGVSPSQMR